MLNKSNNLVKSKKLTSEKSPGSIVSSAVYSGMVNAQYTTEKPGSPSTVCSNQSKRLGEPVVSLAHENLSPTVQYHPWESKYNQVLIREKIQKPMAKNPYAQKRRLITQANESITTKEECNPVLIPVNRVRIEKAIIHHQEKKSVLPNIVRYVRRKEVMPSQRFSANKSSLSRLEVETKMLLPMIDTNKSNSIGSNAATISRLLNRIKMRDDALVIRRPPRRLIMNTIQETISTLTVYS